MNLKRTFHPVGQGAFYSEQFYEENSIVANVVYDCGTQTNFPNLSNIISNVFPESNKQKQTINYLFVSHFHEDHINGIKTLLKKCNVQYIVIPAISNKDILLCDYIHNAVRSNSWGSDGNWFLEQVFPSPNTQTSINPNNVIKIPVNTGSSHIQIPFAKNKIWEYLPYCSVSGNWKTFIEKFKKIFSRVYSIFNGQNFSVIKNFFTSNPNEFDKLKKLYRDYYKVSQKNDNYYSMAVLSKPINIKRANEKICLYTGDFPARDKTCLQNLLTYYAPYWDDFKTFQVPHHGSWHDNPSALYKNPGLNCVISYGSNNQFHHPNGRTLLTLHFQKENLVPVNENALSKNTNNFVIP